LVGNPPGKRQFGRRKCRWEDNIKMDLRRKVCEDARWTEMPWDMAQWQNVLTQ